VCVGIADKVINKSERLGILDDLILVAHDGQRAFFSYYGQSVVIQFGVAGFGVDFASANPDIGLVAGYGGLRAVKEDVAGFDTPVETGRDQCVTACQGLVDAFSETVPDFCPFSDKEHGFDIVAHRTFFLRKVAVLCFIVFTAFCSTYI